MLGGSLALRWLTGQSAMLSPPCQLSRFDYTVQAVACSSNGKNQSQ